MKKLSTFIMLVCLVVSCKQKETNNSRVATLPYYNETTFTPTWIASNDDNLDSFHKISPFSLINQDGLNITEKTFEDKIYIADFFFTSCPGICPKMTDNMMILQETFLNDDSVLLLSHSVTPEKDSVMVLKEYAENKGVISNKWHLVTGEKEMIYELGRKDYFVEEDLGEEKSIDDFLHTENFVLIDNNRHIRGIYNGLNKTAINQLIEDVNTLKEEL